MTLDPVEFNKQIVDGKVSSKLKDAKVTHPIYPLERTYCALCGKPKGWVSQESSKYIAANQIVVVCDDCNGQFGELPLEKANIQEVKTR